MYVYLGIDLVCLANLLMIQKLTINNGDSK